MKFSQNQLNFFFYFFYIPFQVATKHKRMHFTLDTRYNFFFRSCCFPAPRDCCWSKFPLFLCDCVCVYVLLCACKGRKKGSIACCFVKDIAKIYTYKSVLILISTYNNVYNIEVYNLKRKRNVKKEAHSFPWTNFSCLLNMFGFLQQV